MARDDSSAATMGCGFILDAIGRVLLRAGGRSIAGLALTGLAVLPGPAAADGAPWFLMERHGGCVGLDVLVRRERLPRAPASPDEFAEMMRARGHRVAVGPLPGSPPDLVGLVVAVDVRDDLKPVFVRAEVCRRSDR